MWLLGGIAWIFSTLFLKKASDKSASKLASVVPATSFSGTVESWRSLVTANAGSVPVSCALEWMAEESGGNPCAIGDIPPAGSTYPKEYGLFQLYGPSNSRIATAAQIRGACAVGVNTGNSSSDRKSWEKQLRPLTSTEKLFHIRTGLELIDECRDMAVEWLAKSGTVWDESTPDFWNMVKLWHASPAIMKLLPSVSSNLGVPPGSWEVFKEEASKIALANGFTNKWLNIVWHNCERVGNALSHDSSNS